VSTTASYPLGYPSRMVLAEILPDSPVEPGQVFPLGHQTWGFGRFHHQTFGRNYFKQLGFIWIYPM